MKLRTLTLSFLLLVPLAARSPLAAGDGAVKSPSRLTLDDIFPTDRVLDIRITVAKDDWDTIRHQSRNFFEALGTKRKTEPIEPPYTYVEAGVTIDGVEFPKVGIRKKGFIGSQSATRPSLKVKLDFTDPDANIEGLNNLTLNNNKQDVSLNSQFLGYAFFNTAGSPAPRCAFANVTVNGKNLGVYTHVESARRPLLKRSFGDDGGTLYEGTVVDFFRGWEGSFERKFGDDEAGRKKIRELIKVLNGSDEGTLLVGSETEGRAWVPTDGELDERWTGPNFDDSDWVMGRGGAGYENSSGYESHIGDAFNFQEAMSEKRESVYLRLPFEVEKPEEIRQLVLGVKYDDGFIAYLNGQRVAAANAPKEPTWRSRATANHDDRAAVSFQRFFVSEHVDKLRPGRNVLAVHGMNVEASSSDMLVAVELRWSEETPLEGLGDLVDLDAFYRFWAVESLLGFWDGYSGNRNNFFVYLHPTSGKFHFLPWGADSLFQKFSKVNPDRTVPLSVKTEGLIANRLYQTSSGRAHYREALTELLDKHWNEEKLLSETNRIEALLQPYLQNSQSQRKYSGGLEQLREFIRGRRADIEKEIADGMPLWTKAPSEPPLLGGEGRDFFGERPQERGAKFFTAARAGDVKALAEHLDEVGVNRRDRMGSTALSWAAGLGRLEAVRFLIEKGADVNARNRDGSTPLDGTEEEMDDERVDFLTSFLRVRIDADEVNAAKPKIAELLREHGGKFSRELKKAPTDIWAAAREGDVEAIAKFLAQEIDIDARDAVGSTALSWAAGLGRYRAVEFLIEKGADVNAKNRDGSTPLDTTQKKMDLVQAGILAGLFKVTVDPEEVNAVKPKIAVLLKKHGAGVDDEEKKPQGDSEKRPPEREGSLKE